MSDMPFAFFTKELVSQPVYLDRGLKPPWEEIGDDIGILKTNDTALIHQLTNAARARIGGVVRVEEARYEELKKNPPTPRTSLKPSQFMQNGIRPSPAQMHQVPTSRPAPAVVDRDVIERPTQTPKQPPAPVPFVPKKGKPRIAAVPKSPLGQ